MINHKKPLGLFGGYYNLKDSLLNVNDFARVWDSGNIDMIFRARVVRRFQAD
ncbi:MAG: hypothetical protein L6V93_15405 [Clostridiales bacterium]|nr:MAG: hypothetical protein L6V93_15405 [Clostridiales bacterium]